jgi:glycosyltransferase involved in cell wall biosynthesis
MHPSTRSKPRLLYLATFNPTVGFTGTTTRGRLFLRHLAERFETHLVCFRHPGEGQGDAALTSSLASHQYVDHSALGYFLYSPSLHALAARVIARVNPQVIFADFEKAGLYARLLGSGRRLPYVYNSHNVEFERYVDFARRNPLRYPLVPWIYLAERLGSTGAAAVIAISPDDARTFRRWVPGKRVLVKPAAFDEEQFNPFYEDEPTERPIVLMVGNYDYPANAIGARAVVESVIPAVVAARPDVQFRFVGRAFPAGLSHPNMEVAGFVDDLVREYRRASVVLVPVEMGGGIKIKLVEALACGRCVVATPKAMEGVAYGEFECLRVGPLVEFPRMILESLQSGTRYTNGNWEAVRVQFGIKTQLSDISSVLAAQCLQAVDA